MIRRLSGISDPCLESVFDLYRTSFPDDERDPEEALWSEIRGESRLETYFWLAEEEGFQGFCRVAVLPQMRALWGIHIAVDPDVRGQGVGLDLLHQARATRPGWPLIIEVEHPETEVQRRRQSWFRRNGARSLTGLYTQPALGAGGPVSMTLLVIGVMPGSDRQTITDFYREAWHIESDHDFVRRALTDTRS